MHIKVFSPLFMRILGIDPGIAIIGFGVIETAVGCDYKMLDCGCIKTGGSGNSKKKAESESGAVMPATAMAKGTTAVANGTRATAPAMTTRATTDPPPPPSVADRLKQIYKDLYILLKKWQPDAVAIEELFFNKNVKTAIAVAQARGAIMQQFAVANYEIAEYKPQHVKAAVCGYGKADKKQLQKMVQLILKLDFIPSPDDAADALAVAICHANSIKFRSLTAEKPKIYGHVRQIDRAGAINRDF